MADLNVVVLTGRLADDPKLYAAADGRDVTILRLAVGRPKRPGSQNSEADFVDIVVRNGDAKTVARYLAKGCRANIRGRLYQRTWPAAEGQRSRLQVVADQVHFIDYKDRGEQTPTRASAQPATDAPPTPSEPAASTSSQPAEPATDAPPTADAPQAIAEVVVWADGGSRGNPGPASHGVLITTPAGEVLAELAEGIGWATNKVAEYRAVIAGLQRAEALGARQVRVRADSKLVIQQLKGTYKVNSPALQSLHTEALRLADGFDGVTFEHVAREANRRADTLANQAMDVQGPVTDPGQGTPEQAPEPAAPAPTSSVATGDGTPAK